MISDIREYGRFESTMGRRPISEMVLRLLPLDLVAHWARCGMTADYMAHFLAYNFENVSIAQNIISTVLNELVENIVKFSSDKRREVSISLYHYGDTVHITTVNLATAARAAALGSFVERLMSEDLESLFMKQIEQTAATDQPASGLGLLTLMRDYKARLGIRITPRIGTQVSDVFVQVVLDVEEMEQHDTIPRSVRSKPGRRFESVSTPSSR